MSDANAARNENVIKLERIHNYHIFDIEGSYQSKSTIIPSGLVIIIIDLVFAGFITLIIFAWFVPS